MAVPSSGNLSMFGIAKELEINNYNNTIPPPTQSGTNYASFYATPISLKNMSTGAGGFDSVNTGNSASNRPDGSTPHAMSEFYAYDHDLVSVDFSETMTVGVTNAFNFIFYYGYGNNNIGNWGSMTGTSFDGNTIVALYWTTGFGPNQIVFGFSSSKPDFEDLTINGQNMGDSSDWTSTNNNYWSKTTNTNPFGTTSGNTVSVTAMYA